MLCFDVIMVVGVSRKCGIRLVLLIGSELDGCVIRTNSISNSSNIVDFSVDIEIWQ